MKQFLDTGEARKFIEQAMRHYAEQRNIPGWFTDWLDDLYIRLSENLEGVTCYELWVLSRLNEEGCWMGQALAVNTIYHMFDHLGRNTTGMLGY